jgi:hypothetical protein
MINKDTILLQEAYENIFKLNECWSKKQKENYELLIKDGYKEIDRDKHSKQISLKKEKNNGVVYYVVLDENGKETHYAW